MNLQAQAEAIANSYQPIQQNNLSRIGEVDTVQAFLEAIDDGNYVETAAELAGIAKQTWYGWKKRGEDGEEPFKALVDAVKRAEARSEASEVAKVRKAGNDPRFWAASMTYLERRHPERWARRSEGNDGPKVVVQIGIESKDVKVLIATSTSTPSPVLDQVTDLRLSVSD